MALANSVYRVCIEFVSVGVSSSRKWLGQCRPKCNNDIDVWFLAVTMRGTGWLSTHN